jgi:5-hydroxyisourate hydrolase
MSTETTASVSTHILDTSVGRPAEGVAVQLAARSGRGADWQALGGSATDADGRCKDLPALPEGTTHVRLDFAVEAYFENTSENDFENERTTPRRSKPMCSRTPPRTGTAAAGAFFPEVAITFAVVPGEHFHVPLLLNPFGYSVYRGS